MSENPENFHSRMTSRGGPKPFETLVKREHILLQRDDVPVHPRILLTIVTLLNPGMDNTRSQDIPLDKMRFVDRLPMTFYKSRNGSALSPKM